MDVVVPPVYEDAILKARAYLAKKEKCLVYGYDWDRDGSTYDQLAESNALFHIAVKVELDEAC